jgi:Tfp pilus assembly protein PilF
MEHEKKEYPMKKNLLCVFLTAVFMLMVLFPIFAFAADTNKAATLIQSAEDLISKGDLTQAEINIKKAMEIAKDDPWALRVSARIHREQFEKTKNKKYLELAQTEIEESLKNRPNDAWGNAEAAMIYYDQNNKTKATQAIESALKLEPGNKEMQNIKNKIRSMI